MTERLRKDIETALKRRMLTPKDFEFLSESIFARLRTMVSPTTLKRLWGYLDEAVVPRKSTLSILARFLGYNDWDDYCKRVNESPECESNPFICRTLNVMEDLVAGDEVELTWQPGRICRVRYLGKTRFQVISSEKTRLVAGDTFECCFIVDDETLYISNLRHETDDLTGYVCGKKNGVRFTIFPKKSEANRM